MGEVKKYKVVIDFLHSYILAHKTDEVLPVEKLKRFLKQAIGSSIIIGEQTLSSLEITMRSDERDWILKDLTVRCFDVEEEELDGICKIEMVELPDNEEICVEEKQVETERIETEKTQKEKPDMDTFWDQLFEREKSREKQKDGGMVETNGAERDERVEKREAFHREIDGLVGCEEFKALASELEKVAPKIIKNDTQKAFLHQAYILSVNDGDGLSTYLDMLAKLFDVIGIKEREEKRPSADEITLPKPDGAKDVLDGIGIKPSYASSYQNLICFDISDWISLLNTQVFGNFLKGINKDMGERIVVFRVPYVEKDLLARIEESIRDVMLVRSVSFPPFTKNEIKKFAANELTKYGFSATQAAWDLFQERIIEEKSDGRFYGLNTVQKVVREMLYKKQYNNAYQDKDDVTIGKNDLKGLVRLQGEKSFDGMKELSKLIGSEPIVKKVEEILLQIDMAKQNPGFGSPCLHMRFVGNPGTGKTTVARILGKILKERGVLRLGNFYEHGGRDFCGRYIGETAPKTASMCRDAYGSVLFIDEAYTLYRGADNERDFGREALDTLIAEMENHRSDFMVIMAGYTEEMDTLLKGNPGLKNRMPYTIEFPNFTRAQLSEIFRSFLKNKFAYEEELLPAVETYFNGLEEEFINAKDFGNARFVRNLFERTWGKASLRCQLAGKKDIVLTKADFEAAIMEKDFHFNKKEKHRLGFI